MVLPIGALLVGCSNGNTSSNVSNTIPSSNDSVTTLQVQCSLITIQVSIPNSNETLLYGPAGEIIITLTNNTGQGIYVTEIYYNLYDNVGNVLSNSDMNDFTNSQGQYISEVYIGNNMKQTLKQYNSSWNWSTGETCKVTDWDQGQ